MKLFTIFGNPVSHSRSPLMHNCVFKALGIDACYTRTHLEDGSRLREMFFAKGLSGANVTVPHKETAYEQCDEVRGIAATIKAVNTLVLEGERLIGYNTDAEGFVRAIESLGPLRTALIVGAGGTARALSIAMRARGIEVNVLNRSSGRLAYFKDEGIASYTWDDFPGGGYDILINTTSAGLSDAELPLPHPLLLKLLSRAKAAVDVIYGKETPFLREVKAAGLPHKDGSDMLLQQGVLAGRFFTRDAFSIEEIEIPMKRSFEL